MSAEFDIGAAYVVPDFATEFKVFHAALQHRDPAEHANILIVARARAAVSGRSADAERSWVGENADRYAETPQGRARPAYLDRHPITTSQRLPR
jgi:hypothetical protein